MNLLGHFACAAHLPRAAQLGATLPDLLRMHRRDLRAPNLVRDWERNGELRTPLAELVAGVRFHLEVDGFFHRSPLFLDCSGELRAAMLNVSDTPGLKRFFPAHILTELYLDHLLIRCRPGLSDAFYRVLDGNGVTMVLKFIGADTIPVASAFRAFVVRFVDERFFDGYRSMEGVIRRTQIMLAACRQREMEPGEVKAVSSVLAARQDAMEEGLLQFVARMKDADGPSARGPVNRDDPDTMHRTQTRTITGSIESHYTGA